MPPAGAGYRPETSEPTAPPPAPVPARPRAASRRESRIGTKLLAGASLVAALSFSVGHFDDIERFVREHTPVEETAAGTCPTRVAPESRNGTTMNLVIAYRTSSHDVIICRSSSGEYVYHGEEIGNPSSAIDLHAERTSHGYIARNGSYTYDIRGRRIIVKHQGKVIGKYTGTRFSP
ncbi:hypothetical protein [Actinomadura formosensis]|uniref:hypothetical protein n=1 Tax=Actinomadura formosensis TaxID=60706 RepID=UPI003D8FC1EE